MKAIDLIHLWCFGEGSVWWIQHINELCPLIDGVQSLVRVDDSVNAVAGWRSGLPAVVFNDGVAL